MHIYLAAWIKHGEDREPIFSVDTHPDATRFATGGSGECPLLLLFSFFFFPLFFFFSSVFVLACREHCQDLVVETSGG